MKGAIKMSPSNENKRNDSGNSSADRSNQNFKFSDPGLEAVTYFYKTKKHNNNSKFSYYSIQTCDLTETASGNKYRKAKAHRLTLHQNLTDNSNTYISIKFYLPKSAKAKLILMDSEKNDALYFINKRLKAGSHTFITGIRNEELLKQSYYYKLKVNGFSDVKEMKYVAVN